MGLLRIALPYLTDYNSEIERQLSERLNRTVTISRLDVDWHWFSPRLKLLNVNVLKKDSKSQLIRLDEIFFEFGIFDNILSLSFEPTVITVSGGLVNVKRDKSGRVYVNDVLVYELDSSGNTKEGDNEITSLVNGKEFRLLDMKVRLQDLIHTEKYQNFSHLNAVVEVNDSEYKVLVDVDTPEEISSDFLLIANIIKPSENTSWITDLYIDAKDLNIKFLTQYVPVNGFEISSKIDTELWLSFNDSGLKKATGRVSSEKLGVNNISSSSQKYWSTNDLSSLFLLEKKDDEWRLLLDDFNMQFNQSQWQDVYLLFQYNESSNAIDIRCDYLGLEDLSQLFKNLLLEQSVVETISKIKPRGVLTATDIVIEDWKKPDSWILKTRFTDFGITIPDKNIVVDGLSGSLYLEKDHGKLMLSSNNVHFVSDYFNLPLLVSSLKGDFTIQRNTGEVDIISNNILAEVDEVAIDSRIKLKLSENPFLDLQVKIDKSDAQWLNQHKTNKFLGESTVDWLSAAIKNAIFSNSKLLIYGNIRDIPFNNNEGVFQSSVDVSEGTLKFLPDWPEINNIDTRLTIEDFNIVTEHFSGVVYDSKLEEVGIKINLSGKKHVLIDGNVVSNANDVDKFFKATPLKDDYVGLVGMLDVEGELLSALKIDIPLTKNADVKVSGKADLSDNQLKVKGMGYKISSIDGEVFFKNSVINASGLTGVFDGDDVRVNISTINKKPGYKTVVSASIKSDVESLLPFDTDLSHIINNKTDWNLELSFNHAPSVTDERLSLKLTSSLSLLDIALPAPFSKKTGRSGTFDLDLKLFGDTATLLAHYDNKLNFNMSWNQDFKNVRANLGALTKNKKLPEKGFSVSAELDEININKWTNVISPFVEGDKSESELQLSHIEFNTKRLVYDQILLSNASLTGDLNDLYWGLKLNSNEVVAQVNVSSSFDVDKPLRVQFDKMDLSFMDKESDKEKVLLKNNKANDSKISPDVIPPLKISGKNLTYKKYKFESMYLETSRNPYGLTVHALDLKGESLSLKLKGGWFVKKKGGDTSSFRIEVNSKDVGKMLSFYDFTDSIKSGRGSAVIDWQWAASPFNFDWKLLSGHMKVNISDGKFVDIDPGAGRLLGMFSLSALPRRFMLDFSDTFTEGFEFNKFDSKANFKGGDLYTNQTHINGTSADVFFNGRIGLAARDFDQIMSVVPRISSGVSGWLAVLQGAAVGVVAYLGQKLIGVDEAAKNQYHISGSWKEPVIKKISKDDKTKKTIDNEIDE